MITVAALEQRIYEALAEQPIGQFRLVGDLAIDPVGLVKQCAGLIPPAAAHSERRASDKIDGVVAFRPTDTTGTQQIQSVECAVLAVAISGRSNLKGKSHLAFKNQNGTDAGQAFITSYDGGSKIWVEAASPGRPMKGWMLVIPPAPPPADNLIR